MTLMQVQLWKVLQIEFIDGSASVYSSGLERDDRREYLLESGIEQLLGKISTEAGLILSLKSCGVFRLSISCLGVSAVPQTSVTLSKIHDEF